MSSNVRNSKRTRAVRFTETPLTVYDLDEWDPLEGFVEYDPVVGTVDLDYISMLAVETANVANYYNIGVTSFPPASRMEGEEVGDDRIDVCLNPIQACAAIMSQTHVIQMVTSWEDTNLSTWIWNFCEVSSHVPLHPEQSFDWCRKVGEFKDLGFIDVPPLRIILDVMKGDRSHSSTAVGKASMLGSRMRTPRTEFLQEWYLASYLQDGLLRTSRSSEPKYLPQIMGGSGVRAPFGEPENLYLSVHAYRGGRCQRIYGSATRELRQTLTRLEAGEALMPILCRRLRDKQEYLHGTYAEKVFIPTKTYQSKFGNRLPEPLIKASGGANLFTNYENRLIRTRHLITRTGAEREWENTLRIRASLLQRSRSTVETNNERIFQKRRARDEFGGALNANTAFAHLLERKATLQDVIQLTNDNFHVVNCGATHFTRWDAEWLFFGGKSENFSIEDLTTSEDMFLRKEVSEDETLRVGSIPLRPVIGNLKTYLTTTTVGMYQIGSGMYEWASNLTDRLVSLRERVKRPLNRDDALQEYEKDPEWVNDDSLLIAACLRDTAGLNFKSQAVILVSADKRLGNQMSNTCNVAVVRIDPRPYILWCHELGHAPLDKPDISILCSYLDNLPEQARVSAIYLDSGSINAFLARVTIEETGRLVVKRPIASTIHPTSGKRVYRYSLQYTDVPAGVRWVKHLPVQRPKRYRSQSGLLGETVEKRSSMQSSSRLSQKSWRKGE